MAITSVSNPRWANESQTIIDCDITTDITGSEIMPFTASITDWVNQPDVTDVDINPHLVNHDEFKVYRAVLRSIAINPQPGNIDWPIKPIEQWS
jgi:hypothetical protein